MRQGAYCTKVGTMPGTDYRVQPHYMDMLDLAEAWRFGRGAGSEVAVIDTGVSPHPRLPTWSVAVTMWCPAITDFPTVTRTARSWRR